MNEFIKLTFTKDTVDNRSVAFKKETWSLYLVPKSHVKLYALYPNNEQPSYYVEQLPFSPRQESMLHLITEKYFIELYTELKGLSPNVGDQHPTSA